MATVMEFAHRSARQTPRQLNAMLLNWVLSLLKLQNIKLPKRSKNKEHDLKIGAVFKNMLVPGDEDKWGREYKVKKNYIGQRTISGKIITRKISQKRTVW
jgi:hypothetical protein